MPANADVKPKVAGLSKLTVAQLKAICKERKIAGYSKLGKPALIQKLLENGYSHGDSSQAPLLAQPDVASHAALTSTQSGSLAPAGPGPSPIHALSSVPPALLGPSDRDRHDSTNKSPSDTDARTPAPKAKSKPRKKAPAPANSATPAANATIAASTSIQTAAPPLSAAGIRTTSSGDVGTSGNTSHHNLGVAPSPSSHGAQAALSIPGASYITSGNNSELAAPRLELTKGKKRAQPDEAAMPPPAPKKSRIQPPLSTTLAATAAQKSVATRRPSSGSDVSAPVRAVSAIANTTKPAKAGSAVILPAKRFKPLVVGTPKISPGTTRPTPVSTTPAAKAALTHPKDAPLTLHHLDFPAADIELPNLRAITLPPPLAQRKRVSRWAMILSGLSDKERAVCALVSRTFRYAVYLSASSILVRGYSGRRLQDDVLKKYSQAMTNMWPYLRVREAEIAQRRRIYEASFLPALLRRFGPADPISKYLWASPDNPRQLVIAVRFALTRAWFELSVGSSSGTKDDPTSWLHGAIVDAQEVVNGEIWSVTLEYHQTRRRETLYVIEATCEVVGRPLKARSEGAVSLPIRADWSAYIERRNISSASDESLLSHLKWSCHEEFDRGISKLWLKRVKGEKELGVAKRTVAERYVLACVVGNSISGTWLSTSEMAQDFAGLPARGVAPTTFKSKAPAVNLFLPEHHHVESVHFTTSGDRALHPALATVQTPHREYYILRDNGMQVGCEEEGVAGVWQEVLGCDARGVPT